MRRESSWDCLRPASGVTGRRSTPGRYFKSALPGSGWGGTDIENPLDIIRSVDPRTAWPGLRLLMVSTTGEQWAYFELNRELVPEEAEIPDQLRFSAERVAENCEPSVCSVLFMGGAGGSLRAGGHRESGRADKVRPRRAGACLLRRSGDLRMARRRHHIHG